MLFWSEKRLFSAENRIFLVLFIYFDLFIERLIDRSPDVHFLGQKSSPGSFIKVQGHVDLIKIDWHDTAKLYQVKVRQCN